MLESRSTAFIFNRLQLHLTTMRIQRFLATAALVACTLTAWAVPTVDAVQAEVQRGNYAQAETMMQEVVSARPGSAKAHYIYAEILAHNKRFNEAAKQTASARAIDPAIAFTDPAKFEALERLLQREQRATRPALDQGRTQTSALPAATRTEPTAASGAPIWMWLLGGAAAAALAWALFRRRPAGAVGAAPMGMAAAAPAGYAGAPGAPGYGQGYAGGPMKAPGSGLLGVGLAAAGGVAAGMLAEKMLSGGHHDTPSAGAGLQPGVFDAPAQDSDALRQLEERPIDFGSGDGWGGGDAGGSSGSSDDGW